MKTGFSGTGLDLEGEEACLRYRVIQKGGCQVEIPLVFSCRTMITTAGLTMNILEKIQHEGLRKDLPDFKVGDTLRVHTKIKEGDKERIQIFEGVVIRRKGHARESTFTVRKVSYGVGVERVFPLYSPMLDRVEIAVRGKVRRARLYYLRKLSGKKARIAGEEGSQTNASEGLSVAETSEGRKAG